MKSLDMFVTPYWRISKVSNPPMDTYEAIVLESCETEDTGLSLWQQ